MGCTARYPRHQDHKHVPPHGPIHFVIHSLAGHSLPFTLVLAGERQKTGEYSDLSRFGSIELSTSCADKNLLISPSHQQRCASIQICRGLKTPIEIQLPTGARPRKRRRVSCAIPTIDGRLLEAGREPEPELKRPTPSPSVHRERRPCVMPTRSTSPTSSAPTRSRATMTVNAPPSIPRPTMMPTCSPSPAQWRSAVP